MFVVVVLLAILAAGAQSQMVAELVDGKVTPGFQTTANSYVYFNYSIPSASGGVSIVLTPLTPRDVDLYVSKTNPYPTDSSYDWRAINEGGDVLRIDPATACTAQPCWLFIGVFGYGDPSSFTLVAVQDPKAIDVLPGVQQYVFLSGTMGSSYTFSSAAQEGTHIIFDVGSPTSNANVQLYVSSTQPPQPNDPSTYQWSSNFEPAIVTARSTDNGWCTPPCTYYILLDSQVPMHASLRISGADDAERLTPGFQLYDFVQSQTYGHYYYVVETKGMMRLSLTALQGNPDLYVSVVPSTTNWLLSTFAGWPTTDKFTFSSRLSNGIDAVTLSTNDVSTYCSNSPYCVIAIAVFAELGNGFAASDALFDIVLTTQDVVMMVTPGIPTSGTLGPNQYAEYMSMLYGQPGDHVSITVSSGGSSPNLFVGYTGMPNLNNGSNIDASSYGVSPAVVQITLKDTTQIAWFVVSAPTYPPGGLNYTIRVSSSNETDTLQNGIPVVGSVSAHRYKYYKVSFIDDQNIDIVVNALGGDPDLYVSQNNPFPTIEDHQWSSANINGDHVRIPEDDPSVSPYKPFYIGVYGYSSIGPSRFSVVASTGNSTIDLINGIPITGTVHGSHIKYYSLQVAGSDTDHVTFQLNRLAGDPTIYVSTSKLPQPSDPSSYQWHAFGTPPIVIQADAGEPGFCSDCTYYIAVANHFSWGVSNFTLNAASSNNSVVMVPGNPTYGFVLNHRITYFSVIFEGDGDIQITVTPLDDGDPDLYVSSTNPYPNAVDHTWAASQVGQDTLVIAASDTRYQRGSQLYIGVAGFTADCRFIIVGTLTTGVVVLLPGLPQHGYIANPHEVSSYEVLISQGTTAVRIAVTPEIGTGALYVSTQRTPNATDPLSYSWSSQNGNPIVATARLGEPGFCSDCTYYVTVESRYSGFNYSIVASGNNDTQTLTAGVPQYDSVPTGHYAYFRFLPSASSTITLTLTALRGNTDLFVSTHTSHPSFERNDWAATNAGDDQIMIPPTDPQYCQTSSTFQCTYYVAVYGDTQSAQELQFMLVVTYDNGTTALVAGVPQLGHAEYNELTFFSLGVSLNPDDHVSFTVTSSNGAPAIYVSTLGHPELSAPHSYQWKSDAGTDLAIVTARPGDNGYCSSCTYYVGVTSEFPGERLVFTITGSHSNETITLQVGQPQYDSVQAGQYAYFKVYFTADALDIHFAVTALSGDPDVYISTTNSFPTAVDYTWRGSSVGDEDVVVSRLDPHRAQAGEPYYIGVLGFKTVWDPSQPQEITSFMITASTSDDTISLLNGVPQTASVPAGSSRVYKLFVDAPAKSLDIELTPSTGNPQVLVSARYVPTTANYTWKANSHGRGIIDDLEIKKGDPNFCSNCTYYITVVEDAGDYESSFSLMAHTSTAPITLPLGQPYVSTIEVNEYQNFVVILTSGSDMIVSVTPFSGVVRVYADQRFQPTSGNATWSLDNNSEIGLLSITGPKPGRLFISVLGYKGGQSANSTVSSVDFSIAVNYKNTVLPVSLASGVAYNDHIEAGKAALYLYSVMSSTVTVVAMGNTPVDMTVSLVSFEDPSPAFTSKLGEMPAIVVVKASDLSNGTNAHVLYIKVTPSATYLSADITIVANDDSQVTLMQVGQPTFGYVSEGSYQQFSAVAVNIFDLRTIHGNVELFFIEGPSPLNSPARAGSLAAPVVSDAVCCTPSKDNYQYKSQGGGTLILPTQDGIMYIAAYGLGSDNLFSLLATRDDTWIELYPGVSQSGVTRNATYLHYYTDASSQTLKATFSITSDSAANIVAYLGSSELPEPPPFQPLSQYIPLVTTGDSKTLEASISRSGNSALKRLNLYVRDNGQKTSFVVRVSFTDEGPPPSPTSSTTPKPSSGPEKKKKGNKVGIIVGVVFGMLFVVGLGAFAVLKFRAPASRPTGGLLGQDYSKM